MTRWIMVGAVLITASGCALFPGMSTKNSSPSPNKTNASPANTDTGSASSDTDEAEKEAPKPSGPVLVSVSLKNECKEKVKLFFGDKPKFGSGTYSSLGSNTRTSKQMKEGDMIWLVDDSQNGIASVSISSATRNIEVVKSCDGIRPR